MPIPTRPVTRAQAKQRARELRNQASASGRTILHSRSLEMVAAELGYKDWNTASARLSNLPEIPFQVGDDVGGLYLGKPFEGRVHAIREIADGGAFEVTLHFEEPVDVVEFESFSAFRQRVRATVSADGISWSKTSDGRPHMVVERRSIAIV